MSGPRVALVSEHASPLAALGGVDAGGQNVFVAALATELVRRGCEVVVHTRRDDASLPAEVEVVPGMVVEHVDAGPPCVVPKDNLLPFMPAFAAHLAEAWRVRPPDVVHAHFWMSGHASTMAARPLRIPVVQTFHALGTVKRRHQGAADTSPRERLAIERSLLGRVDAVFATCRDEVAELVAMGGPVAPVHVVPCGVDPTDFDVAGPVDPRCSDRRRLVCVSRLVPRKGVEDAVRALAALPDVELVIAGGPPAAELHRDEEVRRLRAVAAEIGVADRVDFRGALARPAVAALMRSATAVVCTPWYEPFGIVPLEAMACGVPVIGSAVGGLLDSVADQRTGFLVAPRDPSAIAAAARRLLDDPALAHRLGRNGRRRVLSRFTWEQVGGRTLGLYEQLLAARNRVPA